MFKMILLTTVFLLASCSNTGPKKEISKSTDANLTKTIQQVPILSQDKGYRNFRTQVLKKRIEFNLLLSNSQKQINWEHKKDFLDTLRREEIDFKTKNLLIYRFDKAFKYNIISQIPKYSEKNIRIFIEEKGEKESVKNSYYTLFYVVDKDINNVIFEHTDNNTTVKNYSDIKNSFISKRKRQVRSQCTNCQVSFKTTLTTQKSGGHIPNLCARCRHLH